MTLTIQFLTSKVVHELRELCAISVNFDLSALGSIVDWKARIDRHTDTDGRRTVVLQSTVWPSLGRAPTDIICIIFCAIIIQLIQSADKVIAPESVQYSIHLRTANSGISGTIVQNQTTIGPG